MVEDLTQPVYYRNAQWAVTGYGMECLDQTYYFEASRLGEGRDDLPDWPLHLAEKEWVNPDLFLEAFMIALSVHAGSYKREFKEAWYLDTARLVERLAA